MMNHLIWDLNSVTLYTYLATMNNQSLMKSMSRFQWRPIIMQKMDNKSTAATTMTNMTVTTIATIQKVPVPVLEIKMVAPVAMAPMLALMMAIAMMTLVIAITMVATPVV
uniref:Uncharacterized protein n=1 Tax=Cacopsylla melanoneura TaxID=428564 RepID=A0A8D8YG02_9HEMI